jgi:hypothetical protein
MPFGVFHTCSYNHAHRLRLGELLYVELSRSFTGQFKPLLGPGGGCASETAARSRCTVVSEVKPPLHNVSEVKRFGKVKRFDIYNAYIQRPFPNGQKRPFGCNGYVTVVAAGQSQRFYSGMGI